MELSNQESAPVLMLFAEQGDLNRFVAARSPGAQGRRWLWLPGWQAGVITRCSGPDPVSSIRLEALYAWLLQSPPDVCLTLATPAILQKVLPAHYLLRHRFHVVRGALLRPGHFKNLLLQAGYTPVSQLEQPGQVVLGAEALLVWPFGHGSFPLRLGWLQDQLLELERWDPRLARVSEVLPEVCFQSGLERPDLIPAKARDLIGPRGQKVLLPNRNYYQPWCFDTPLEPLLDWFPENLKIEIVGDLKSSVQRVWKRIHTEFQVLRDRGFEGFPEPSALWLTETEFFDRLAPWISRAIGPPKAKVLKIQAAVERETVQELNLGAPALLTQTETLSTPSPSLPKSPKNTSVQLAQQMDLLRLTEFQVGDYVVHRKHGVGRYLGLRQGLLGSGGEYCELEFAQSAKLYLPAGELHVLFPYARSSETLEVALDRLGGKAWEVRNKRVATQVRDAAAALLSRSAERSRQRRLPLPIDWDGYARFCGRFPYVETPDQAKAMEAVLSDLSSDRLMDRILCGEVGFGKTEVALRACFLMAQAGRQSLVLTPTTLLAQQHFDRFMRRFQGWPFKVDLLSRFRSESDQQAALRRLARGEISVLVGTTRLMNPNLRFQNLGLLVVDEEHRFGVAQKELADHLGLVDKLSLTATPIPRTLSLAMVGLRELSLMVSPPEGRRPVQTHVCASDWECVKLAIWRELERGGQVYYVSPHVRKLESIQARLAQSCSGLRMQVVHGQLPPAELEARMESFCKAEAGLLLCSSIIETGLDLPNVNTLIVEQADRFGLAQLHQLRGRIGRGGVQGYAYFLYEADRKLNPRAKQRLEALEQHAGFGAGFFLAERDLELRGSGDWLGEAQSGKGRQLGPALYLQWVRETAEWLACGHDPDAPGAEDPVELEFEIGVPALIPETYLSDPQERLRRYRQLSSLRSVAALFAVQAEWEAQYGALPQQTLDYFRALELRVLAKRVGLKLVKYSQGALQWQFSQGQGPEFTSWQRRLGQEQGLAGALGPPRFRPDGLVRWQSEGLKAIPTRLKLLEDLLGTLDSAAQDEAQA